MICYVLVAGAAATMDRAEKLGAKVLWSRSPTPRASPSHGLRSVTDPTFDPPGPLPEEPPAA